MDALALILLGAPEYRDYAAGFLGAAIAGAKFLGSTLLKKKAVDWGMKAGGKLIGSLSKRYKEKEDIAKDAWRQRQQASADDKIAGIPRPGEEQKEALDRNFPDLNQWERAGAGGIGASGSGGQDARIAAGASKYAAKTSLIGSLASSGVLSEQDIPRVLRQVGLGSVSGREAPAHHANFINRMNAVINATGGPNAASRAGAAALREAGLDRAADFVLNNLTDKQVRKIWRDAMDLSKKAATAASGAVSRLGKKGNIFGTPQDPVIIVLKKLQEYGYNRRKSREQSEPGRAAPQ